uniref:Putative secreted protein n=1 Tax=Ixodes ricinus TaxID=34613 RepID=A0A6B0UVL3_IXORI
MNQLLTWRMVSPVSWASCFFWSSEGYGCVRCWKSQARMMLVATLGKMPRFFWRFLPLSSSSSSPVPSPEPTLASPCGESPRLKESTDLPASLLLSVLCCELGCCGIGPGVPAEPVGERTSSAVPYELRDCDGGRELVNFGNCQALPPTVRR